MTIRQSAIGNRQCFAWHGWQLALPAEWNPVRVEGDWRSGFVLFADLERPRLGLRWGVVKARRFDASDWARRAIRDEVGERAARDARPARLDDSNLEASTLYVDPDPPGRDVWVAFSRASGRGVELIHHARKRESGFGGSIVPTLADSSPDAPTPWSIFDLTCVASAGMKLVSHQLGAGDVRLCFADRGRIASMRRVAVARLALARMPLAKWLANERRARALHYRSAGDARAFACDSADGRALVGIGQPMRRCRRFCFLRRLPPELFVTALHDEAHDRLILAQSNDESAARAFLAGLG